VTTLAPPAPSVKPRKPRMVRPASGTIRLTIHINGVGYAVRPLTVDPASGVSRLVRLRKSDGTEYHASRHPHGCECTCPDWIFSRDGRDPAGCKHLVALGKVGLL
jgi:hypothetical protein